MPPYTNQGPVNCDEGLDTSSVKGKAAIVTGGANGIGEAYVRALTKAGAFVVIADLDEEEGTRLESELGSSVKFVKCNVTVWADQLALFKTALSSSPSGRIDIVIANAGISGGDPVFFNNVEAEEPEEPTLNVLNVNLTGVMYTVKLALHYFRRQNALNKGQPLDHVLILQGSLAGYLSLPGATQYSASKYALRGVMKSLRMTEWQHNIRLGYIAPWFIETKILSEAVRVHLKNAHTEFATVEDAAAAVMRIVSDSSITGMPSSNGTGVVQEMRLEMKLTFSKGRSLAILPRSWAPHGYVDLCDDDEEGSLLYKLQHAVSGSTHRSTIDVEKQKTRTQW